MAEKIYWVCENKECHRMFTTEVKSVRRLCDCRMFMKSVTKEKFQSLRIERRGKLLMAARGTK